MPTDPVEGMARTICAASGQDPDAAFFVAHAIPRLRTDYPAWEDWTAEARAAWAYALARLREPSEAMVRAYWDASDPDRMWPRHTERVEERLGAMLDAFAREIGSTMPRAGAQGGLEGPSGAGEDEEIVDIPRPFQ